MEYKIEFNSPYFLVSFFGETPISNVNQAHAEMFGSAEFDESEGLIADFTGADVSLVTAHDTTTPAAYNLGAASFKAAFSIALVATEEHAVKMCQTFIDTSEAHESPWRHKIFSSLPEAQAWIKEVS